MTFESGQEKEQGRSRQREQKAKSGFQRVRPAEAGRLRGLGPLTG